MSQGPVSGQCSPAPTQEPSSPTAPMGKCLRPAQHLGCSHWRPGCHRELQSPGTFVTLQLCLQVPVTSPALKLACVECSTAELGEPFPSLAPFLPPSAPCWHFPCCHHIPTCFLVDPSLCTWSPFSWLLLPRVVHEGPPVSPGSGKWGDFAPCSDERAELPPRCFQPKRALSIPISSLETRYATGAIPGKCSCHIYLRGYRGFQASSPEPFPSIHTLEALPNRLRGE